MQSTLGSTLAIIGHIGVVKWLINHGAKLSLDKFGKSPINDAAENQQTECLNVLVKHNSDYMMSKKQQQQPPSHNRHQTSSSAAKVERFHMNNRSFISKGSTSSDSEPFYLHPPSTNGNSNNKALLKESFYGEKNSYYGAPMPNEGIFINPMRSNFNNPPSPSDSGESFFLHDPQEIIYNRVKDIFESDTSLKEETTVTTRNHHKMNAVTVQAEIHSSSSCTASGSDIDENQNKNHTRNEIENFKAEEMKRTANQKKQQQQQQQSNLHDYEDIYLVREEAKNTRKNIDRNRSRDSGSHSRSRSSSSTRSQTVIVETNVSCCAKLSPFSYH